MNKTFKLKSYSPKKGVNREPGECDQLLNSVPSRVTGSEVTRYGYTLAGSPFNSLPADITADYFRYVSTESPSAKDVLFLFGHTSGNVDKVYMYSYLPPQTPTTWTDGWILLNESLSVVIGGVSGATDTAFTSATTGIGTVADHHNGWIAVHPTKGTAYIKDYSYSGGTGTFTTIENIGSAGGITGGLNWVNGDTVILYRWMHANPTFTPTFDFPSVSVREGIIKVSPGKGSGNGNKDLWVGYIKRTFFPGEGGDAFTYEGTYVEERECKQDAGDMLITSSFETSSDPLVGPKTYHLAYSLVYDGYQYGKLRRDLATYQATSVNRLDVKLTVFPNRLSKRVTAIRVYLAQDDGNTASLLAPVSPYYFIKEFPLTTSEINWTLSNVGDPDYDGAKFTASTFAITNTIWEARGNDWITDSGYDYTAATPTNFSHDLEVQFLGRQWIARVYDYVNLKEDLDRIYTNPRGADGIIQPDIFSLEPDSFTFRAMWGDSSYITGIIATERGRLIVLKDRAVVDFSFLENPDGTLLSDPNIVSTQVGCASANTGYVITPSGVFFAGYDDLYLYDGQLTGLAFDDFGDTYRNIVAATKQAAILWYRTEDQAVHFQINSTDNTYTFLLREKLWRQTKYNNIMTGFTVKRDSTVIWTTTGGTAFKFDTSTSDRSTGDAAVGIPVKWDTGKIRLSPTDMEGFLHKVWIWKPQVASDGTLKCDLLLTVNGQTNELERSSLAKGDTRLLLSPLSTDSKTFDYVQIQYNTHATPETGVVEFSDIEIEYDTSRKMRLA